jgi:hypothetical protein
MHWTLQNTVWIAGMVLEFAIAVSVLYQRLWQIYPAFVSYILCEVVRSLWLFAIGNGPAHYARYFYTYWITECIVALLGFVVVREIFSKALSAKFGLQRWGTALFWWSLAILILIAALAAVGAKGGEPDKLLAAIFLLKRVESLVRLGLIVALFVFVFVLGIPWADPVIGIAAGFGIYGAGELVAFAIRSSWGRHAKGAFSWTLMGIGLCQEILWLAYFFPWHPSSGKSKEDQPPGAKLELDKLQDAIGIFLER